MGATLSTARWCAAGALAAVLAVPAQADAAIPASLKDACSIRDAYDGDTANGRRLPYWHCDDGVPDSGGTDPNEGAARAIAVPQRYRGWKGLPRAAAPEPGSGADSRGNVALDANLSLPDPRVHPPGPRGYPLITMMHGCCGGKKTDWEAATVDEPGSAEKWHYSNAWYASRGYAVLTYTSRGFLSGDGRGSTGFTQLQHRAYEINDFQSLAGQVADARFRIGGRRVRVNGRRVVATGGSYGGGFSWMALTDPTWRSPKGSRMRLAAVAPKYGWTDLVQSLVPNGRGGPDPLPATDGSDTANPFGFPKQTIVAGLYASGKVGLPTRFDHATFPRSVDEALACLQSADPFEANPLCRETIQRTLPEFIEGRSAYYQDRWFRRLERGARGARVPIFSAATFTDPLFPPYEHARMVERILRVDPRYPVQEYYGDYQHFVQNKRSEWADLCAKGEVCDVRDYRGRGFDRRPRGLSATGVTTRLNRFIDHYARPPANARERRPRRDVTAALQVCPQNATERFPADGPGRRYRAASFDALAPRALRLDLDGVQTITNPALPNLHARAADPVFNQQTNDRHCPVETAPAGNGVATYTSEPLERARVMIGQTRVAVRHARGEGATQLNTRLYDVFPGGTAVMVDRGVYRMNGGSGPTVLHLQGNAWRFEAGHRIRIELSQDDSPYIKASVRPSALPLTGVALRMPVRR